jgi:hypothetical protein
MIWRNVGVTLFFVFFAAVAVSVFVEARKGLRTARERFQNSRKGYSGLSSSAVRGYDPQIHWDVHPPVHEPPAEYSSALVRPYIVDRDEEPTGVIVGEHTEPMIRPTTYVSNGDRTSRELP